MVLDNGTIVFNVSERSILDLQFKSEVLNVVFSAALTTMLAYQLSAICYNVFLGWKSKGRATASDFHKLILSEASSPLAVLAAVARSDRVDRLRFKRDIPPNVRIARRETPVTKRVTFNLLSLLLVAPLFNLISIFIVLQKNETLTFGQANFPGVTLGTSDEQTDLQNLTHLCDRVGLRLEGAPATPFSQFTVCFENRFNPFANFSGSTIRLSAELTFQGSLEISAASLPRDISATVGVVFDMASDEKLYRIEPLFRRDDAARIIHKGQRRLAKECESAKEANSPFNVDLITFTDSNTTLKATKDFECNMPEAQKYVSLMFAMLEVVNVVEQDVDQGQFKVALVEDISTEATSAPDYFDARSVPFLVRRTRIASVMLLLVALILSVIVRIITGFVFNNDVDEGLEAVLRYRLGTEPHESLLKSSRTVRYNTKRQSGATAHYGLQRSQLPEVDHFGDGIEIGLEENTWHVRSRGTW